MKRMTRREQLKLAARTAAGAALALVGVSLVTRPGKPASSACSRKGLCDGCSRTDDCVRPEAMSYREVHR